MNCDNKNELILNLDKLHTTELGVVRMKRNLYFRSRCMLVILLYFYKGYQLMYIDKYNIKVKKLYMILGNIKVLRR